MRVHTSADLIAVKIDDESNKDRPVIIKFRPLTYQQRKEVLSKVVQAGGNLIEDKMEMCRLAVRYSVKSVSGLETASGDYSIEMDPDGFLSDKSLDDIMNIPDISIPLMQGAIQIATNGPFRALLDETGEALQGVSVIEGNAEGTGSN